MVPQRRGYIRFEKTLVGRTDPLGLFKSFIEVETGQTLLVLPEIHPVPNLELLGSRHYQRGGLNLASSVGDTGEFISLREYRPGDQLRHIHWRSWARTGKPVVKEFEDEYFVRHALILDTFVGPDRSQEFEAAVSTAASCLHAYSRDEGLIDLIFMGRETYQFTAGRGMSDTDRVLEIIACVQPASNGTFADVHHAVISQANNFTSCLCVLADWNEERHDFVAQLAAHGIPAVVFLTAAGHPRAGDDLRSLQSNTLRVVELDPDKLAAGLADL